MVVRIVLHKDPEGWRIADICVYIYTCVPRAHTYTRVHIATDITRAVQFLRSRRFLSRASFPRSGFRSGASLGEIRVVFKRRLSPTKRLELPRVSSELNARRRRKKRERVVRSERLKRKCDTLRLSRRNVRREKEARSQCSKAESIL